MLHLLAFLAIAWLLLVALASIATALRLAHPPRRTYAWALSRGLAGDPGELDRSPGARPRSWSAWTFRSRGVPLEAWDIAGDEPDGPIVILSHGWGDSRVSMLSRVPSLLPVVSRVVLWDMPGQGESPGSCTLGAREGDDLAALIDTTQEAAAKGVVLYGRSMGAGVSIIAALKRPAVRAIILEAPYRHAVTPAANVLRMQGLPSRITLPLALAYIGLRHGMGPRFRGSAGEPFDRAELAAGLGAPLLVLHGDADEVSPVADGREIARAGRGRIVELAGAGHQGLWTNPATAPKCAAAVGEFIRSTATTPAP